MAKTLLAQHIASNLSEVLKQRGKAAAATAAPPPPQQPPPPPSQAQPAPPPAPKLMHGNTRHNYLAPTSASAAHGVVSSAGFVHESFDPLNPNHIVSATNLR